MNISFDVNLKGISQVKDATIEESKKVLFKSMKKMEELAKRRCPVDTGVLRRSINLMPRNRGSKVYTLSDGVEYGAYVEYGTRNMIKAHGVHDPRNPVTDWEAKRKRNASGQSMPFFRPALLEVKEKWLPEFWASIKINR